MADVKDLIDVVKNAAEPNNLPKWLVVALVVIVIVGGISGIVIDGSNFISGIRDGEPPRELKEHELLEMILDGVFSPKKNISLLYQ